MSNQLNNRDLLRAYERKTEERLKLNREIKVLRDVMTDRIVSSEDHQMTTETKRVTIQYINADRVKSIKEIEDEYGEEWIDENRRRLVKPVESKKIKIEPLEQAPQKRRPKWPFVGNFAWMKNASLKHDVT